MTPKLPVLLVTIIVSSLLAPLLIASVQAAGCVNPCSFEVNTNVPSSEATVWVRADGGTPFRFSHTFSFANDTTHTIEVMNTTLNVPSTGARYVFRQWSHTGAQWAPTPQMIIYNVQANYTTVQNGPFVAEFEKQFQLSLSFSDPTGKPLSPPSWVTLQSSSSLTITSYSGQWLKAQVWSVVDAYWEGVQGSVYGSPTVNLSNGPTTATVPLKAYPATILVIDSANKPVAGVAVTATFVNSTSKSFTTDSQGNANMGYIPLGPYTAHLVYQNQDLGDYSIDASQTPTNTVKLGIGGQVGGAVVSAVVLLTIFGVAMLLLLLAIKVRKPPLPPTIN